MSCGGSKRIRGSKLMSLAPALLTQHTAAQLMGRLAGWQTGNQFVCLCMCVSVHISEWMSEWSGNREFVHAKWMPVLWVCVSAFLFVCCASSLPTEPYLSQPSGFRSLGLSEKDSPVTTAASPFPWEPWRLPIPADTSRKSPPDKSIAAGCDLPTILSPFVRIFISRRYSILLDPKCIRHDL